MLNTGKTLRVHLDTEFTDFVEPELISIGLVSDEGHEFYGENLSFDHGKSSEFVQKNIYPLLKPAEYGMKERELSARLWVWLDELPCDFVIISADYTTDLELFEELLGDKHPKILEIENFRHRITWWIRGNIVNDPNPETSGLAIYTAIQNRFKMEFIDYFFKTKEIQHHALSDAKANRAAWLAIKQDFGLPN